MYCDVDMYCDNVDCDSRETVLIVMRGYDANGRDACQRGDVQALDALDSGRLELPKEVSLDQIEVKSLAEWEVEWEAHGRTDRLARRRGTGPA